MTALRLLALALLGCAVSPAQACGDDEAWMRCVLACRGDRACRAKCDAKHGPKGAP